MPTPWKPTKEQLEAARNKTVRDVIAPNLSVLFCGINPGLYTAAVGHHFARPGNRFWPTLFVAGFTDRLLSPFEERELLKKGFGITNMVMRTTASAAELTRKELADGSRALMSKVRRYQPKYLAVLGLGAYRDGFGRASAAAGRQPETIDNTIIWVLPNPSGLNANYQRPELVKLFNEFRRVVEKGVR